MPKPYTKQELDEGLKAGDYQRVKRARTMTKKELTKMLKPTRKQLHDQDQTRLYQERHGKEQRR